MMTDSQGFHMISGKNCNMWLAHRLPRRAGFELQTEQDKKSGSKAGREQQQDPAQSRLPAVCVLNSSTQAWPGPCLVSSGFFEGACKTFLPVGTFARGSAPWFFFIWNYILGLIQYQFLQCTIFLNRCTVIHCMDTNKLFNPVPSWWALRLV